jgi:YVTN family beta-propeller protein
MAGYTSFKQLNRQLEHLLQQTLKYLIGVGLLVSLIVAFISMIGNSVSAQDQAPWNRLYIANYDSNNVSVVDLNQSKVIAEIPVGKGPTSLAVTPDLDYVYVSNFLAGTVSVISTAQNAVTMTIPIPSGWGQATPFGLAITPDGSKIFVANPADGTVRVISTDSNRVTSTITGAYDWALRYVAMSPDGQFAYAAGAGNGVIYMIKVDDHSIVARIPNLAGARHTVVTPDGSRLYIASESQHCIYVVDTATRARIDKIQFPIGAWTITVDVNSAGKFAMVANYHGKVSMLDIDPSSPTYHKVLAEVPPFSNYQYCIAISPDSRFAYLTNQSDRGKSPNSLNIIDIDPRSATRNTIINSIPVGKQPFGLVIVKQPSNSTDNRTTTNRTRIKRGSRSVRTIIKQ